MDQKRIRNVVQKYRAKYIWNKVLDAICQFDLGAVPELAALKTEQKDMKSKERAVSLRW